MGAIMLRSRPSLALGLVVISLILLFIAFNGGHSDGIKQSLSSGYHAVTSGSNNDLKSRLEHSERLWRKNLAGRKHMRKAYGADPTKGRAWPNEYVMPYNIYDFVYPAFNCPHDVERVGRVGDGGKWVCGMTRYEANKDRPCVVYAFGVNDDSSFENEILRRTNCEIWGYDYTVKSWGKQLVQNLAYRAHFSQCGIANVTDEKRSPPFYSVKDLMRINGHDYIDIMKMDIEGSEFDSLGTFLEEYSSPDQELPVGQLLLETHMREVRDNDGYSMPKSLDEWIAFWESLEAKGLRPSFLEPNLLATYKQKKLAYAETTLINIVDKRSLLVN
ncbi:hypothetical protein AJ80_05947 [Polytolypa hystricis UAMH7299]|uniref:Methyltransferase domain-containing protein n=1 Tax=Polytolypa hystricis (strain UAMH7299) TaxID=1447883 RepID=A0A2B7Y0W8_POLH7|nr:hypothetical protein AJ80_05947 [Polytolypa hystricis UAMH7299]